MKKFLTAVTGLLVLLFCTVCAAADTTAAEIDPAEEISLTVVLEDDGDAAENIDAAIYRVADVEVDAGGVIYTALIGGIDYDGMTASGNEAAAQALSAEDLSGLESYSGVTDQEGKILFENLSAGAWLVLQTSGEDTYQFAPFIAFAPQCSLDGSWIYVVTAYPKSGSAESVSKTTGVKTGDIGWPYACAAILLFACMGMNVLMIVARKCCGKMKSAGLGRKRVI